MIRRPSLKADDLHVRFDTRSGPVHAVRGVSFDIAPGECLALIGESGSGKSATARALMGLAGDRAKVTARELTFAGMDLLSLDEPGWRRLRGRSISMVLQDALVALDPLRRVGTEVVEAARAHGGVTRSEAAARVPELLASVGVPEPRLRARQYPHELSGGLRQRALIASAIAGGPELLLADEPTTALDATVAAQVLDLLRDLRTGGMALLLISHDLTVVNRLADRVGVMHGGRIVEWGSVDRVLRAPRHPYTRALLDAVPAGDRRGSNLSRIARNEYFPVSDGCSFAGNCPSADARCSLRLPEPTTTREHGLVCWHPLSRPAPSLVAELEHRPQAVGPPLIEVSDVTKRFRSNGQWRDAVRGVSFELRAGEVLGVVGESGSGKTTTARIVLGLDEPDVGSVRFDGQPWSGVPERVRRPHRRHLQQIHQDALSSFDPRLPVERVLAHAVAQAGIRGKAAQQARVAELLDQVGLPTTVLGRRPRELSGGQRQRVDIARALAPEPRVVICDEPVSALDVSVQAQVLDLLAGLRRDLAVAMLFISHDLGVIHHISDRVLVMRSGRIVESGTATGIFSEPADPYTRELLSATQRRATARAVAAPAS